MILLLMMENQVQEKWIYKQVWTCRMFESEWSIGRARETTRDNQMCRVWLRWSWKYKSISFVICSHNSQVWPVGVFHVVDISNPWSVVTSGPKHEDESWRWGGTKLDFQIRMFSLSITTRTFKLMDDSLCDITCVLCSWARTVHGVQLQLRVFQTRKCPDQVLRWLWTWLGGSR